MTTDRSLKVAVLASGSGTNLQALLDQVHGRQGVRSSPSPPTTRRRTRSSAPPPQMCRRAVFARAAFAGDRLARDRAMADWLREQGTQLVVMAGYMQLVSEEFLDRFPDAVINLHPSLLPAFPGIDAVGQSLAYGVKIFGVTVHFADGGLDTGPVIMQRAVELPDAREPDDVWPHLHAIEHQILPEVVRLFARGAVRIASTHPRRVLVGPLAVMPEGPV